jgi:hypothetical protein
MVPEEPPRFDPLGVCGSQGVCGVWPLALAVSVRRLTTAAPWTWSSPGDQQ